MIPNSPVLAVGREMPSNNPVGRSHSITRASMLSCEQKSKVLQR